MFYEPKNPTHGLPHDPFLALAAPRPIGWIGSVSAAGVRNLAPYSFFNAFSTTPHIVGFSSNGAKDSLRNIAETGAFTVNIVSADMKEAMNLTSAAVPPETDEFALAGLEAVAGEKVKAPRVREAKAAFECLHLKTLPLSGLDGRVGYHLVLGEVVGVHLDPAILTNGRVDIQKLRPVVRLGYTDYAIVEETFAMPRP